jgi:hypothetical protein
MNQTMPHQLTTLATVVGILVVLEAAIFFLASLVHLGIDVPILASLEEPRRIPAAIIEGLGGLFFAISAYSVFTRRSWTWIALVGTHAFAVAGILWGMFALAMGRGPRTEANDLYHQVMLLVAVAGLILLATPIARAALGRNNRPHDTDESEKAPFDMERGISRK